MDGNSISLHALPADLGHLNTSTTLQSDSLYFFFLAPEGTTPNNFALPRTPPIAGTRMSAYLTSQNGRELPLIIRGGFSNPRAMEAIVPHDYPPSLRAATLKLVAPLGDISAFHLSLPLRENLPKAPMPAPNETFEASGIRLAGEAWCEPPSSPGEFPVMMLTLKAVVAPDPKWMYDILAWRWMFPDREVTADGAEAPVEGPTRLSSTWQLGRADTYQWLVDPPLVRSYGTIRRDYAVTEPLDFGPVSVQRVDPAGFFTKGDYTIPRQMTAATPSGLTVVIFPRGPTDQVPRGPGRRGLQLIVRTPGSFADGLPRAYSGSAVRLEIGVLDTAGDWVFRRIGTNADGTIVASVPLEKGATSVDLHLRLRRRVMVESIPFDMYLPVRHDRRSGFASRLPMGGSYLNGAFFDPVTMTPRPQLATFVGPSHT